MTRLETPIAATASARGRAQTTRALLRCGIVAGPLFVAVAAVQVLTRDGFDLRRHPISMLSVGDLGAVELNEAFATQSLASMRRLGLDPDIVNNDGGAISLGHPLGSSGSRLAITLLGRMEREDARIGLATMCIGVGQGTAMLLERV